MKETEPDDYSHASPQKLRPSKERIAFLAIRSNVGQALTHRADTPKKVVSWLVDIGRIAKMGIDG